MRRGRAVGKLASVSSRFRTPSSTPRLPTGSVDRRTLLTGGALVALAVPSLRAQARLEKPRIAIAVGDKSAFYFLPLTIAERLGYFRAAGLDVVISDYGSGTLALQSLVGGTADVGSGAFRHTISLQSRGQFFRAFAMQGRAPQVVTGVSVRALPGYRGPADLRGRRIGITEPGSATHLAVAMLLARGGLRLDDATVVGVGTGAAAREALRSGEIEAICNVDPVITQLEQKGDLRVVSDTRTQKGTREMFGGPMPAGCLYASDDFLQKHPRTAQALADAMVHALKWLQTAGPGDLLNTVPEAYLQGDRALYLASFQKVREAISPDGLVEEEGARTAVRALTSFGFDPALRSAKIDPSRLYTNEFALRAKQKFQA